MLTNMLVCGQSLSTWSLNIIRCAGSVHNAPVSLVASSRSSVLVKHTCHVVHDCMHPGLPCYSCQLLLCSLEGASAPACDDHFAASPQKLQCKPSAQ